MKNRNQHGAIAVMAAFFVVLMLSVGALAVDLGNAYQRKRELQSQADLAALSASAKLPNQSQARAEVKDYLTYNLKAGQTAISSAALADGDLLNGEVQFPAAFTMKVYAPAARVNFGLATVMGFTHTNVAATATVQAGTPAAGAIMPYYAVGGSGCDFGPQALTDPANGQKKVNASQVPSLTPPLSNPDEVSNKAESVSVTPFALNVGDSTVALTITGKNLSQVSNVAFLRGSDDLAPAGSPNAVETAPDTNPNNQTVTVAVPVSVANTAGVWWIRTYSDTNGQAKGWTPVGDALPIRVGDGVIACQSASASGNFGSLKLPRQGETPASWLALNAAIGLKSPLSLAVHPSPGSGYCLVGGTDTVYSDTTGATTPLPDTNCVDSDPGLTASATSQGLITSYGGTDGRLKKPTSEDPADPSKGCAPDGTKTSRTVLGVTGINNDRLSCFLTTSTTLGAVSLESYGGPAVFSDRIYSSPRFVWIPVIKVNPSNGGSEHYAITDFRPAFITSETMASTKASPQFAAEGGIAKTPATTSNGLIVENNRLTSLGVIFFNSKALPTVGDFPVGPYVGKGPMAIRLVD